MDQVTARRLLGVSAGATQRDIEVAFRSLVMSTHPDRGGRPEAFRSVVEARRTLLAEPTSRRPPSVTVVPDGNLLRQLLGAIVRRILDGQGSPGRRVM